MRNPFNWVGNKYNYMKTINKEIANKKYNTIYELFMGSGNILVNLHAEADLYIGNDIIPLLPNLYNSMEIMEDFKIEELNSIINEWNNFSDKKHYYEFRDHWNKKYLSKQYDRNFVYETILLLKMCSNSMVRFNRKEGYFNQGFRGLGKGKTEFFSPLAKNKIIQNLNEFKQNLNKRKYTFYHGDFKQLMKAGKDDLVILDPPYILSEGMYGTNFTEEDDAKIFEFLNNTKADFILFNYLTSGDRVNGALQNFLDNNEGLYMETINVRDSTGQGRTEGKEVVEVMVSRIS